MPSFPMLRFCERRWWLSYSWELRVGLLTSGINLHRKRSKGQSSDWSGDAILPSDTRLQAGECHPRDPHHVSFWDHSALQPSPLFVHVFDDVGVVPWDRIRDFWEPKRWWEATFSSLLALDLPQRRQRPPDWLARKVSRHSASQATELSGFPPGGNGRN